MPAVLRDVSLKPVQRLVAGICAAAAVLILLFSLQHGVNATAMGRFAVGIMVAAASFAVGVTTGFLFQVPHAGSTTTDQQKVTNLGQIADWLTKILVGLGLTQVTNIPKQLGLLGDYVARGLGGTNDASVFILAVILLLYICGFFVGYLWTTLKLQMALVPVATDPNPGASSGKARAKAGVPAPVPGAPAQQQHQPEGAGAGQPEHAADEHAAAGEVPPAEEAAEQ